MYIKWREAFSSPLFPYTSEKSERGSSLVQRGYWIYVEKMFLKYDFKIF